VNASIINSLRQERSHSFILLVLAFLLILAGCDKEKSVESSPSTENGGDFPKEDTKNRNIEVVAPIDTEQGSFYSAYGWLDDNKIIYITEANEQSQVYSYDLASGDSELMYESSAPIISLEVSPSRKYILVHSSISTYEGHVEILDLNGNEVFSKDIASADLAFAWNPSDENIILVSSFTENWEFSSYQLNIQDQSFQEISLPQPFVYWIGRNKLLYLDWDENSIQLVAPLKEYNLKTNENEDKLPAIFQVDSFADHFMTISIPEEDQESAEYAFYSKDYEKLQTIKVPILSSFSDWLVPYYDFLDSSSSFLTFQPLHYASADLYKDGFQLVRYNIGKGKQDILFENLQNEPLSCSPNGDFCLYGHYFEKLINLKSKEIFQLNK
jgi:hypothetical protein